MSDAAAAADAKVDRDELTLRARPRPVTRLNRRAVIGLSVFGATLILGALLFALKPSQLGDQRQAQELYNVTNKNTAKGLDALPKDYRDLPPRLGAPLPGDLGSAVLEAEGAAGITEPMPLPETTLPFRPDPLTDAERADRLRRAQQSRQARESEVFFKLTGAGASPPREQARTFDDGGFSNGEGREQPVGTLAASTQQVPATAPSQSRKLAFLNQRSDGEVYNRHPLIDPVSPYQLMAGTVIAASLITGINSDLPGAVVAHVTENVFDTVTGRFLLIPQGTRLVGRYDSLIAHGQERALVVWQRIILPDGSSVVVDSLPATDMAGYAGLEDEVDFHTFRLIKGIALATLLGVSSELTFNNAESDLFSAIRESAQDTGNEVGQRFVERELGIQPTITVRPGWPLRIIVNRDIVLRPYEG